MREILEGIFTWPWFSQRHGYDFNGYLVRHPGGNVCVDPVEMAPEVEGELASLGVDRIVLTIRNHFRASMKVKERTGAPIAIHPADAAFAREKGTRIDEDLRAGEHVGPFEIVASPGKSPGECALLPDAVIDDKPRLAVSQRTLAALDFDALLLGDGAPILEGGRAALRRLVEGLPR